MSEDMRQDVGMGLMGALALVVGLLISAVGNEWLSLLGQFAALLGGALVLFATYGVARALMSGR